MHFCDSVDEAERIIASHTIDVVVSDVNMTMPDAAYPQTPPPPSGCSNADPHPR